MFSWLGELVPVFWLTELDLISLKGGAVSSSLDGSSMCLGSPSGPGSVRHIYFHSCFKVALSAYLHCPQPPTCLRDHCYASVPLSRPALLAEACWAGVCVDFFLAPRLCPLCCGDFCGLPSALGTHPPVLWACVHLCQLHGLGLCITGLECACLGSPHLASALRGLCPLVSPPGAQPLRHGLMCA